MKKVAYAILGVTFVIVATISRAFAAGGSDMVMMGWVGSRTRRSGGMSQRLVHPRDGP